MPAGWRPQTAHPPAPRAPSSAHAAPSRCQRAQRPSACTGRPPIGSVRRRGAPRALLPPSSLLRQLRRPSLRAVHLGPLHPCFSGRSTPLLSCTAQHCPSSQALQTMQTPRGPAPRGYLSEDPSPTCEETEMYSPTAMDSAPAVSAATPDSTMVCLSSVPPPTPAGVGARGAGGCAGGQAQRGRLWRGFAAAGRRRRSRPRDRGARPASGLSTGTVHRGRRERRSVGTHPSSAPPPTPGEAGGEGEPGYLVQLL